GADRAAVDLAMERARKRAGESFETQPAGEKLTPNDIGMMIAREHVLMKDAKGHAYEYNGHHWYALSLETLRAYANRIDTHEHTTERRRTEAANFALTQRFRPEIAWRQIAGVQHARRAGRTRKHVSHLRG
ncbi:MAG: hypothetical protein ACRD4O_15235, partial [Bryobacteraceae bacterium]